MKTATTGPARSPADTARSGLRVVSEDGILTGIVGAVVVMVVFLLLDLTQGRAFFTPPLLGSVIFQGQHVSELSDPDPVMIFAYTGCTQSHF
jgi:hypothetical protein